MTTRINKNQIKIAGGLLGQALVKQSNADYDYDWGDVFGIGGAGGTLIDSDPTQKHLQVTSGGGIISLSESYTIAIPGGTLGTKGAIEYELLFQPGAILNGAYIHVSATYGGQNLGTVAITPSTSASLDLSFKGIILANVIEAAQKSLMALSSQTGASQANALDTDYQVTTVDSTIEQDLVVTISITSAISQEVFVQGIIVKKIVLAGNAAASVERVSNIATPSVHTLYQPEKVFFIGDYMVYWGLGGTQFDVFHRDPNTRQWTFLQTTTITGVPVGYTGAGDLHTDGTKLYSFSKSLSNARIVAVWEINLLTGAQDNPECIVDFTASTFQEYNAFVSGGKVYAVEGGGSYNWYESTYTPGGSTTATVSTFAMPVTTETQATLSTNNGFVMYRTTAGLSKIEIATNTIVTYSSPMPAIQPSGASLSGPIITVAGLMPRVINTTGPVYTSDLEIITISS